MANPCKPGYCSYAVEGPPLEEIKSVGGVQCRSVQELALMFEISRILENSFDLTAVAGPILRQLQNVLGLERGTITVINRDDDSIMIDEAIGIPRNVRAEQYLMLIHGQLKRVIKNKAPVIIPDLTALTENLTPAFQKSLERMQVTSDTALIIVPMLLDQEVIGTLSIERKRNRRVGLETDVRLLSMIATIVAQAARIRQDAAEQIQSLKSENDRLQKQIKRSNSPRFMKGTSSVMQEVFYHIEQVADSKITVLLRGESGTGKELVAKAIYEGSDRKNGPFIKFNCAALPDSIIESELFGHEKGAFTGATGLRKGRFETADGGTIFLDEIGDISPAVQVKLLRVLQEREFERVGSQTPIKTDVRVIAATSRNLEEMIANDTFREDLYYRLNVFPIYMPPLRERKCDILLLADHFVDKYCITAPGKKPPRISSAAIDLLMSYYWPGNVRELENCIERAVVLAKGQSIKAHHLPPTLQAKDKAESSREHATLDDAMKALERELIVDALKDTNSNMAEAARKLGLTERKIGLRVRKYKLDLERYKQ